MAAVVSIEGIDEAIKNLDYKAIDSPKLRLIRAIRAYYHDELALTTLQAIDPDTLVSAVWDIVPDENRLRSRRKNLTSIRSSVNLDLKSLFENGKNPDGIIIGPSNTFVMSDEAKDQMLTSVAASVGKDGPVSLGQITRTLSVIEDLLAHTERFTRDGDDDRESGIRRLKHLIKQISERIDLDLGDGPTRGETPTPIGPPLYPAERRDSNPGHGRPGDGGTGHANSESGLGNSEGPGTDGTPPERIEAAAGSSDGSGGNRVGAALGGAGVPGAGLAVEGSEAESGALGPEAAGRDDPIPEEVPAEEEELDEVDVIDEPEKLAVVDEPSAEGPGGSADSDEPGPDSGDPQLGVGGKGPRESTGKEESSDGVSGPGGEVLADAVGSLAKGGSDGDRIGTEGAEADFLQEEAVAAEEDLEEVEEAVVEDETPVKEDILVAGAGAGGFGPGTVTMAEGEGGGDQAAADHETGEHPDVPVPGDRDQAYLENAGSQAATGQLEADPPEPGAQADVEELDLDEVIEEEDDSDMEALGETGQAGTGNGEGFQSGTGSGPGVEPSGGGQGMDRAAAPEMGLPLGSLGLDSFEEAYQTHGAAQATDHKLLSETFDGYLGAMERFYNQYILIPKGAYTVGGGSTSQGLTERRVRLPEFYMGKFPITNALFEIFVEKTGYRTTAEKEGHGVVYYSRCRRTVDEKTGREHFVWNSALVSQRVDGACWYQPSGPGSTLHRKRNHPVVQVSLEDAAAFSAWTGKRLPSEAEWEAASRSKDGHLYPWGDVWVDDRCNVEETRMGDTTAVDTHLEAAGPSGIADTLGNVMEWTLDRDQIGENTERPCYIVKGGSWASTSDICLCSRFKMEPDARSNILGFRCVAF